ncbi:MAG: hypothetical protein B6I17_03485 [Tenericutes bacterium 4572_104]|nr:MAG: hypothetical protein B6I17_03485 [Tenericutes bacterium 4572_104]
MNNKSNLKIKLINRYRIKNDYYCFDFKKPINFNFIEGQYSIFGLIAKDIKGLNQRVFSIIVIKLKKNPNDIHAIRILVILKFLIYRIVSN